MRSEIAAFRRFGRAFTWRTGLLQERPYDPSLTLLESRIVFELARARSARAKDLAAFLSIDKGYLSRVLAALGRRRLVGGEAGWRDKRERWLALTAKGRELFRTIDSVSAARARAFLAPLGRAGAGDLCAHLRVAGAYFGGDGAIDPTRVRLRDFRAGDLGWAIQRNGEVYRREFGWNADYERLVAEVLTRFARTRGPRERAWIAEAEGVRLGCVFLVKQTRRNAKLRILLVEPAARGLGVGSRLVRACLRFARRARYERVTLWTNSVLTSARRIYEANGFRLDRVEKHRSFGKRLTGQYWSKRLPASKRNKSAVIL